LVWAALVPAFIAAAAFTSTARTTPARADTAVPCAEPSATECPPQFTHVWTIVLENSGLYTTFGLGQVSAPYLARTLPSQGAFVPNYYGTGHSSLDNYIAMTSGQAPNSNTQGDCTDPSRLGQNDPTYHIDGAGQAIGNVGCVYKADVPNIASQLQQANISWKAYNETMDANPGVKRTHCQGPDTYDGGMWQSTPDPNADTRTANQPNRDEYRAKHNPFVYYENITSDLAGCDAHDVPLGAFGTDPAHPQAYDTVGALRQDLASEATTPAYSFITPNQCSDGHDDCTSGTGNDPRAKLAQMDAFLQKVVPMIQSSPAYGDPAHPKGLIVITFDEGTDSFACCDEQPSPELAHEGNGGMNGDPFGPGGGITGAVVLSPAVTPGTVSLEPYNHYSYLRTVEDIFGLPHIGYAADSAYPPASPTDNPGGTPKPFGSDIFK
jgi:phosphatidylinositol-3-phosphatase